MMSKFLRQLSLCGLLFFLLVCAQHLLDLVTPYYWGNYEYRSKITALQEMDPMDLYFFGSSRTARHVIPEIVSDLTQKTCFNLGSGATFNPESYYLISHFIEQFEPNGREVHFVIELQRVEELAIENLNTYQALYHLNLNNYEVGSEYFKDIGDLENANLYTRGFIKNRMKSSIMIPQLLTFFRGTLHKEVYKKNNGFLSVERRMKVLNDKDIKQRRRKFLQDTTTLHRRKNAISEEYKREHNPSPSVLINMYRELFDKASKKGIKVIFLKSPRAVDMKGVYDELDTPLKLDLSNPIDYPDFYKTVYSFDGGHFNDAGAELFSIELGKELRELLD